MIRNAGGYWKTVSSQSISERHRMISGPRQDLKYKELRFIEQNIHHMKDRLKDVLVCLFYFTEV